MSCKQKNTSFCDDCTYHHTSSDQRMAHTPWRVCLQTLKSPFDLPIGERRGWMDGRKDGVFFLLMGFVC